MKKYFCRPACTDGHTNTQRTAQTYTTKRPNGNTMGCIQTDTVLPFGRSVVFLCSRLDSPLCSRLDRSSRCRLNSPLCSCLVGPLCWRLDGPSCSRWDDQPCSHLDSPLCSRLVGPLCSRSDVPLFSRLVSLLCILFVGSRWGHAGLGRTLLHILG